MDKYWWVWPVTVFASVNSIGFWAVLWVSIFNQGYTEIVETTVTTARPGTDEMSA